jgi:hypothetical protein
MLLCEAALSRAHFLLLLLLLLLHQQLLQQHQG